MSAPTLSYGGTTVTLAHPTRSETNERRYDERRVDRRTASGRLRTQVFSHGWAYKLGFANDLVATYESVVALWEAAVAGGGHPVFTWAGGPWGSATSGVSVALTVSPIAARHDFTRSDWSLELVEVDPR